MKLELPNSTVDCDSFISLPSGKFILFGVKFSGKDRLSLIVVNDKTQAVVGTYRTKMRTIEQMQALVKQIAEDRTSSVFRSFSVYANAWVSKNGKLRLPINKIIKPITPN